MQTVQLRVVWFKFLLLTDLALEPCSISILGCNRHTNCSMKQGDFLYMNNQTGMVMKCSLTYWFFSVHIDNLVLHIDNLVLRHGLSNRFAPLFSFCAFTVLTRSHFDTLLEIERLKMLYLGFKPWRHNFSIWSEIKSVYFTISVYYWK